ncbi:dihydroxyacetone kinase subunit DhaL [Flavobacteriaceae bacterium GF1]
MANKNITLVEVEKAVQVIMDTAFENEDYFSELDGLAGDGDFGNSLATGFQVIREQWDTLPRTNINAFLMKVAMLTTSHVGGSSGPIWGTAFMRAAIYSREKDDLNLTDIVNIFDSAIEGIMQRGGAQPGDKTLIDALIPTRNALAEVKSDAPDCWKRALKTASEAATQSIEDTKNLQAKRGRQCFTGERSIGTVDPGIVAVATIMNNMNKAFTQ